MDAAARAVGNVVPAEKRRPPVGSVRPWELGSVQAVVVYTQHVEYTSKITCCGCYLAHVEQQLELQE